MSTSITDLIDQLADVTMRNAAREELVRRGTEVTPILLRAADASKNPEHYKTILRTLLLIKDPQAASLFRHALISDDEEVRAIAARGLHLLRTPDALNALQATINDSPDPAYWEQTAAVQSLIELGTSALPTVFVLMDSTNENTRRRAQHVLASVVLQDITRRMQPRPLTNQALQEWEHLQRANGSYQWNADASARTSSIELWKRWYAKLTSNNC